MRKLIFMSQKRQLANASAAVLALCLFVVGCGVHVKKESTESGDKNVTISTPFGGMHVKTDEVSAKDTGLQAYPGARLVPKRDNNDSKANVDIDTPWFGLKVVALKYESDDSPEKIWEFYKKDMAQYGRVLECKPGSSDLKIEKKNKDDLTCEKGHSKARTQRVDMPASDMELRVGTDQRMRVVGFTPSGKGTQFSLVYVVTREGRETL
jgi:hypothetical protein